MQLEDGELPAQAGKFIRGVGSRLIYRRYKTAGIVKKNPLAAPLTAGRLLNDNRGSK
jgi:hypothetical protein